MFIFLETKLCLYLTTTKFNSTSHVHARYRGLSFEEAKLVFGFQFQAISSVKYEEQFSCDSLKHQAFSCFIICHSLTVQQAKHTKAVNNHIGTFYRSNPI